MFILVSLPLLAACEEEVTPPAEQEEEQPPAEEEEEGNWWDEFGEPEYGGSITIALSSLQPSFDTFFPIGLGDSLWFEASLFEPDWTLDRSIWDMKTSFVPDQYLTGQTAESWEITDQQTVIVHLREGITWQDKEPVNGREFTAYDVEASLQRRMDPQSMFAMTMSNFEEITATDNYTIVFKFKTPCGGVAIQTIREVAVMFEAPEWVALSAEERDDWHNAVGAGPWILTDFVSGTSMTYSKNPTYWGNDPRYPENPVPYVDTLTVLVIPDPTARIAALRSGQIDVMSGRDGGDWKQASTLENTNPEINQEEGTPGGAFGVVFRLDMEPFTDIRVRKALQMSINREVIAESLYGGYTDGKPCGGVLPSFTGYAFAYEDWPQELKDEYAYNPDRARELLAEAAADGVFEPNEYGGFDTNVVVSNERDIQLLEVFQSYFLDIGVDMEINAIDPVTAESYLRSGQHDQMAGEYGGRYDPPVRTISIWYSKGPDAAVFGVNDPVYDAIYDRFMSAEDANEAAEAMMEADRRIIEQHWAVWMLLPNNYTFWQPYLKGYSGEIGFGLHWARLWIDQDLKQSMGR
jgi:peptide/nickel transport system substrate-binding protein